MATSSLVPLPAIYPGREGGYPGPYPPEPFQAPPQHASFQFKEPAPPGPLHQTYYPFQQIQAQHFQMEQAFGSWNFGAAIQGIVPEPERFGDLCEKGLVPITVTPTCDLKTACDNQQITGNTVTVKSEPKLLPQSCETTYVTTSQPLMCHGTVPTCSSALPNSMDYSQTPWEGAPPCTADQMESYHASLGGWPADLDPFYSSDMRPNLTVTGHSSSTALPSPWDFYRPSNT